MNFTAKKVKLCVIFTTKNSHKIKTFKAQSEIVFITILNIVLKTSNLVRIVQLIN